MRNAVLVALSVFHSFVAFAEGEPGTTAQETPAVPAAAAQDAAITATPASAEQPAALPEPAKEAPAAEMPMHHQGHEHHGERGEDGACGCPAGKAKGHFDLSVDGHLRVEAGSILPDRFMGIRMPASYERSALPGVGRNDGFGLGDARLNLRAVYRDNLYVRLGFDGALVSYADDQDTVGALSTGLKDAYLRYTFVPAASIFVGRFKPPFDVEELTPTEDQFFVHRALESRGVLRHEGPHGDLFGRSDVAGFAPGRQMGVMLGSDKLMAGGAMSLGYALAVTNGNSGDAAFNDNDLPAAYGRFFARFAAAGDGDDEEGPATHRQVQEGGIVGLSGFYNELSYGLEPSRYSDRVIGAGLDVAWHFMVFYLQGQLLGARTDAMSRTGLEPVYSLGGHAQVSVQVPDTGFYPGYRFALLDPREVKTSDAAAGADVDRVVLHTVGFKYIAESMPLILHLEYAHSVEQGGRAQANDRVEAATQVTF
ncbi:MAG: hypothetical protein HY903_10185 [Deltaproteobacteria bacterium]|nr:hypothetical protein [Deltaproteobacteria bacterium]